MNTFEERFPDVESINRKIPEYQDIYYDHFKKIYYSSKSREEIERKLIPVLESFGWHMEDYQAFGHIDMMQRIHGMKMKEDLAGRDPGRIKVLGEDDVSWYSFINEIKCHRRTEAGKTEWVEIKPGEPGYKPGYTTLQIKRKNESPK